MSFESKGFWVAKGPGCLTDGELAYDNPSRNEPKRAHQWFIDGNEPELFSNKKQAIESSNNKSVSGIANMGVSQWENTLNFQSVSGQFSDRLFGSETARAINFGGRNIQSVNAGNLNMRSKDVDEQFGNDPSVGLSISHTMEDPGSCLSYSGIRKVKINQVKDSDNGMCVSMGQIYNTGDNATMSMGHTYNRADERTISMGHTHTRGDESTISMGHTYSRADDSVILMGHTYSRGNDNTISMGRTFNRGDDNAISMGHTYNRGDDNAISMGHTYNRGDDNAISMGHTYSRVDDNTMSMGQSNSRGDENISMGQVYDKGNENTISMGHNYNKSEECTISMGHNFNKGEESTASIVHAYNKGDSNTISMGHIYDKGDNIISMGHIFNKGESTTISFGGYDEEPEINPSGGLISSYNLLMSQSSVQPLQSRGGKELVDSNADRFVSTAQLATSGSKAVPKNKTELKMSKKLSPNNFPSNVKSLLSTGMLDGVPVKYISWSRERELRGVIKGSGYLCSCQSCHSSKAVNAYEFERHACCKTKHPNNHIFFENGKTVYGIVQELRSTPQNLLFEAIQTVTGSPINQKAFCVWKESFKAATHELQRIYGKDELRQSQKELP
ncbi:uncharacterized protein LOC122649131 isoform X2 [Telopea speciosissima]|uniref:uncharacterized protein LOC122649131 isoform X2 n=1 Tax=Telopea speciosissima TaxID=54955 RepID=UPI001CC59D3F|nr:uncharacterized protein LOC122649131 isoform X2 [Telopea speciosissima]